MIAGIDISDSVKVLKVDSVKWASSPDKEFYCLFVTKTCYV